MSDCADLARAFFEETLRDSPVLATQLGIDGYDDQLDDELVPDVWREYQPLLAAASEPSARPTKFKLRVERLRS